MRAREDLDAFIGCSGVGTRRRRAKSEDHDKRGDDEHAGDDGDAYVDACAATVEERELRMRMKSDFSGAFGSQILLWIAKRVAGGLLSHDGALVEVFGIVADHEMLHDAGRHHTPEECSHETDEGGEEEALPHHKTPSPEGPCRRRCRSW